MFDLKPLTVSSLPGALARAERYRLLNEPGEAESICRDILEVENANQPALISLVLALTDQIPDSAQMFSKALATVAQLELPYDRAYYGGICWERRAKGRYHQGGSGAGHTVYEWITRALELFGEAENLRPEANDDALLRWNACVRFLKAHTELAPRGEEVPEAILSE